MGRRRQTIALRPLCLAAVVAAAACAYPGRSTGKDVAPAGFVDTAAQVCPTLILRPDKAPATFATLGFTERKSGALSATWIERVYERKDPGSPTIAVQFSSKTFADVVIRSCVLTSFGQLGNWDIAALRARLEADPDVGPLEGDVAVDIPKFLTKSDEGAAFFKRPGTNPILTVRITKTARFSLVSMGRVEIKQRH